MPLYKQVCLLDELEEYQANNLTLEQVIEKVRAEHLVCALYDTDDRSFGPKRSFIALKLFPHNQPIFARLEAAGLWPRK